MRLLYFCLFIFILQGCTTKEISSQSNIKQTGTGTSNNFEQEISTNKYSENQIVDHSEESFGDEFEDEFSEKETNNTIDPLSGYNKVMTSFNDNVIIYVLSPIAKGYATILPQPFRLGISNFVHNIQFPIRFTNNLLQGKFQNSSNELERFIVNSTIGLAGLMDPAKHYMNIHPHEEDFGQTLGHYGVGSGFHVVLPFIGPSNVRDILGITADGYLSPLINVRGLENYKIPQNLGDTIGIYTIHLINKTSLHLGEYEDLKKDAIELYPFLRDIYEQKRNSEIAE